MKRIISIILVSAMCLAMLSVSAFTASADANTINISSPSIRLCSTWASTASNSTVQSIYGSENDVTFNYWYFILLEYNTFSGSYRVVDTSGFDAYGNSTRPDENYTSWTLGSNRVAIMAKKAENLGMPLPTEVLNYLAEKLTNRPCAFNCNK